MAQKSQPANLELQILSVLWEKGPSTVWDVLESMPDGKKRAYTSVLSVLQVMEKKGLLTHKKKGLVHVFSPKVKKKQVLKPIMQKLASNIFGGQPSQAMQFLLEETDVSDQEMEEIHKVIHEYSLQKARNER